MNAHRETQGLLYDHAVGLLDAKQRRAVEAHLEVCGECRADLGMIREVVRELPLGEFPDERLGEGYWRTFAERVEAEISAGAGASAGASAGANAGRRRGALRVMSEEVVALLSRSWKPVWATAGVLAIAVLAFVITADQRPDGPVAGGGIPNGIPGGIPAVSAAPVRDSTSFKVARYLKKSGALLVGIANREPRGELVDLGLEREASRNLIRESRNLRDEALDSQSAALLRDLESIMIEIASRDNVTDRDHYELIRNGISDANLLFKIRMTEELMNRQVQLQSASYEHIR